MPNKILKPGQSRLILISQLRAVALRSLIEDKKSKKSVWSLALSVFHPACEAYRIEMRLRRIPRRWESANRRYQRLIIMPAPMALRAETQPMKVKECVTCHVLFFNSDSDYCQSHRR